MELICNAFGKPYYFAKVYGSEVRNQQGTVQNMKKKRTTMDTFVTHLTFNPKTDTYTSSNGGWL